MMSDEDCPQTQTQESLSSTSSQGSTVSLGESAVVRRRWGRLYAWSPPMQHYDLAGHTIRLGRLISNDIIISKSKFPPNHCLNISKEHFYIVKEDHQPPFLVDNSKNGTFINGELVGKGNRNMLQNDDVIAIGHKSLKAYVYKQLDLFDCEYLPPELKRRYVVSSYLGRGACGEVRLAYEKSTCLTYAIKKIPKGNTSAKMNNPRKINSEVNILKSLSHIFTIKVIEVAETDSAVYIVLEYMPGGELTHKIESGPPMSESEVKFIFYQIVLGVQYLHQNKITHRDLKPENVLLTSKDENPLVKISDFGLSKVMDCESGLQTICGTLCYVAPEILDTRNTTGYNQQVDVWSMGVILYFMLLRKLPFKSEDKKTLSTLILTGTIDWSAQTWRGISNAGQDLVRKMLVMNPNDRITVDGVLQHPWLEKDLSMQELVNDCVTCSGMQTVVEYNDNLEQEPPAKRSRLE